LFRDDLLELGQRPDDVDGVTELRRPQDNALLFDGELPGLRLALHHEEPPVVGYHEQVRLSEAAMRPMSHAPVEHQPATGAAGGHDRLV
jgi:hypothetical protein